MSLAEKIGFAAFRNVNITTGRQLLEHGVNPARLFSETASELSSRSGLRESLFDASARTELLARARREEEFIDSNGIEARFFTDGGYPARLLECEDAPAILYTLGNANFEPRHSVGIVGTRHATSYGTEFTAALVHDLAAAVGAENLLIVSGLAYGIDIAAHNAALREGVPTGAVLAHGLNTIYPADHRQTAMRMVSSGGFLATEYPSWTATHRGNFLARNRIVAGLSDVLIVVESDVKGGAMSTARVAAAYNRDVMALPGRVTDKFSRGCNELIVGHLATPIRDAADLINLTGWKCLPREGAQKELVFELEPDKEAILRAIHASDGRASVNELCVALGIPFQQLTGLLFELEMDSIVVSRPGNRFGLTREALAYLGL